MRWEAPKPVINYDRFKCRACKYTWKEPVYEKASTEGIIKTLCGPCAAKEEDLLRKKGLPPKK